MHHITGAIHCCVYNHSHAGASGVRGIMRLTGVTGTNRYKVSTARFEYLHNIHRFNDSVLVPVKRCLP